MKKKNNCWEEMDCGHEPGGRKSHDFICPASTQKEFDGINGGKFAGRFCWWVVGTCCQGEVQGEIAKKLLDCCKCSFFIKVVQEEESGFVREIVNIHPRKNP